MIREVRKQTGVLEHWNAVAVSKELQRKPLPVCVDGREIVLFRKRNGESAAINDSCVHRRMRLSEGCVVADKLQCPYHGWTFDCEGNGESPGTPKLHARTTHYDVREMHGAIWIKDARSTAEFPRFDIDGYVPMTPFSAVAPVPMELALDNFTEIEHTATIHAMFGYVLDRMDEVTTEVDFTPTTVHVVNRGPHKPMAAPLRWLTGVTQDSIFTDEWVTYFSPVYAVIDHKWSDRQTGREAGFTMRYYIFLTPIRENETLITTLTYAKSPWPGKYGGLKFFRPFIDRIVRREVALDCNIMSKLADKRADIRGMKLSRFDRPLGLHRERIERIYRQNESDVENDAELVRSDRR